MPSDRYFSYRNSRSLRNTHDYELCFKFARTNICKYSYFYHTIDDWNGLPSNVVCQDSLDDFKSALRLHVETLNHDNCDICKPV